jgi:hypothetical protein
MALPLLSETRKLLFALFEVSDLLPASNDILLIWGLNIDDEELSATWEDTYFGDDEVCSPIKFQGFQISDLDRLRKHSMPKRLCCA